MPTTLTLAATAGLLPVQAVKQPPTAPPHKLSTIFCKSDPQAIACRASWVVPSQGANLPRGA